ncbi:hypothetical protein [Spiroplasma endosymbiont of Cantharis nigra]|uniref:hypothetical protein n=1 Tax=Spiroplasma endosymbiont of Cantharis nigra TaxID=3066278 RepID=UPI0030CC54EE
MLLIICFESYEPVTEKNVFNKLRQKDEILEKLDWKDVIFHSFQLKDYQNEKVIDRLKTSLFSIPHYAKPKKFNRVLLLLDNDVKEIINKFLLLKSKIIKSLEELFIKAKGNIHHINIPENQSFEYFLSLFCQDKKIDFSKKVWETHKSSSSNIPDKIWTMERLDIFEKNLKKYSKDTNWRLIFKNEK